MNLLGRCCLLIACFMHLSAAAQQSSAPYRNSSLSVDARVQDLLKRMTLEEKVAQLESTWQNHTQDMAPDEFFVDETGQFN